MANVDAGGFELLGPDGVLAELTKRLLERGLSEELSDHLGHEPGDATGRGSGNNRNGTSAKTVLTDIGAVDLDFPRDRSGGEGPRRGHGGEPGRLPGAPHHHPSLTNPAQRLRHRTHHHPPLTLTVPLSVPERVRPARSAGRPNPGCGSHPRAQSA